MVTDLDLNEQKDIHLDSGNDLSLTSGFEQLQQSVAIDLMDELHELVGGRVTGQNIGMLENRIENALADDPQVDTILTVNIDEYSHQTGTLSATVRVSDNEDFTLQVDT